MLKYLKTHQGYTSGSVAGRDDGYPDLKLRVYEDSEMEELSQEFGTTRDEHYYLLQSVDLVRDVMLTLDRLAKAKDKRDREHKEALFERLRKKLGR